MQLGVAAVLAGVAAVMVVGCNQVFGLDPGAGGDAVGADSNVPDDGDEPDAVTRFGPWGNAAVALGAPMVNEDDPILSADGQELIYAAASAAAPGKDLWRAGRDGDGWTAGVPLDALNSAFTDGTARFGAGDVTIYLGTDRPVTQGITDVWRATRPSPVGPWDPPEPVPELSSSGDDRTPSPCLDDSRFVLLSDRNGVLQLLELVPGQSANPIDLGGLTPVSPFITADCLTLYFAGIAMGATDFDLYITQRPALAGAWTMPQRIDELTTAANETDPWLSADGRHLLFTRDLAAASDIWEAFRDPI